MKLGQAYRLVRATAEGKTHIPVLLEGESGIGKSAIVKQAALDLGIPCVDLRLATQEPGDLIGIPRADITGTMTTWLSPTWFPKEGTRGILFLDEINRAPAEVRQAVFQVLTDWKMHEHVLPEDWSIILAVNPDNTSAGYQVESLDPAMLNRMVKVQVTMNADEWLAWAHTSKLHEGVIGFIAANKEMLHKMSKDGSPFPSPRTWHYVSTLMQKTELEENCFTEVVSGLVGSAAATAFATWMKKHYQKPVSGKDILEDFAVVKEKVTLQSRSSNNITVTDLAALLTSRHQQKKKLTKTESENVRQFIFALPDHDDVRIAFIRKVPPPMFSAQIIGEQTDSAEKLAVMYNAIYAQASKKEGEKVEGSTDQTK